MREWTSLQGMVASWLPPVAVLALFAACAPAAPQAKPQNVSPAPAGAAAAQADAPAADRVVRGGTFVIGNHNDLVNFDTMTVGGGIKLSVMGLVQNGLMKWGKTTVVDHS